MIKKVLKAATIDDLSVLRYPLLATPKFDGIRCIVMEGKVLSATLKPIPNKHIVKCLKEVGEQLGTSLDGELIIGPLFQDTTSGVMSSDGEPNFIYYIFDCLLGSNQMYKDRVNTLIELPLPPFCESVVPIVIKSEHELLVFEQANLDFGHEGVMLRSPTGRYKQGRSTIREQTLMKLKRFEDSEARIIGYEEELDGFEKPMNTLGAIVCEDIHGKFTQPFKIGTGYDHDLKAKIWDDKEHYASQLVCYKFQRPGSTKEKPRLPVFKSFRHREDVN